MCFSMLELKKKKIIGHLCVNWVIHATKENDVAYEENGYVRKE